MRFIIDPRIFDTYPTTTIGIVVAHGITNKESSPEIKATFEKTTKILKENLDLAALKNHPYIKAWQAIYKDWGVDKKNLSSVENLATRVLKGDTLRSINSLVDIYNNISLKYLLPLGAEDLDTLSGDIRLTLAGEHESPSGLLGQKNPYVPFVGEVIYKDAIGTLCAQWNWRGAERSKLTEKTKNAIFVIDAVAPIDKHIINQAINDLAHTLEKECGGIISKALLDKNNAEIILKSDGIYQKLEDKETISVTSRNIYALGKIENHDLQTVSTESQFRIEKAQNLEKKGINAWPSNPNIVDTAQQVVKQFEHHEQQQSYTLAGRILSLRLHGKTAFADIQDGTGQIQIYCRKDLVGDTLFDFLKDYIDIGDIVLISGAPFRTKTNEITIEISSLTLLSKCLHPLPDKFHGLSDTETRYRQRYLDLISNPESREKFIKRTRILNTMRSYLNSHGYIEVETPMLHPIAGGAAAKPFTTYHNALESDFYLRIAPELYLKRLVIGGFDKVYEINRNFRNEGISTRHNPEFTMAEFYTAYKDYHFIMDFVESMLRAIVHDTCSTLQIPFGAHMLDFSKPFKKISVLDAVIYYGGIAHDDLAEKRIDATLLDHNIEINPHHSRNQKIYTLFETVVEQHLIQPTFITEYPLEVSPLAKRDSFNSSVAARYELFIAGIEISNGYNELNDPFDQKSRFEEQLKAHRAGDEEAHQFDADYINALEYGLPPTVGVGIGIDRLTMLLTNTTSIKDVILFPTLKKK